MSILQACINIGGCLEILSPRSIIKLQFHNIFFPLVKSHQTARCLSQPDKTPVPWPCNCRTESAMTCHCYPTRVNDRQRRRDIHLFDLGSGHCAQNASGTGLINKWKIWSYVASMCLELKRERVSTQLFDTRSQPLHSKEGGYAYSRR